MTYIIKKLDKSAAHQDTHYPLLKDNLNVPGDLGQRMSWYYNNPMGTGQFFTLMHDPNPKTHEVREEKEHMNARWPKKSEDEPPVLGGTKPDLRTVGTAGVTGRPIFVNGKVYRAALLGDFCVDKAHRTLQPAVQLQREVRSYVQLHYDVCYAFPNKRSMPVHLRVGYRRLGERKRFVRMLQIQPHLERVGIPRYLAFGLASMIQSIAAMYDVSKTCTVKSKYALEWLADVDARFDDLWERSKTLSPVLGVRAAIWLRWRFLQKPDEPCHVVALVHPKTRTLLAYAMLSFADEGAFGRVASLRDLFGESPKAVDALISLLIPALRTKRIASISMHVAGDRWLPRLLFRHGFFERTGDRTSVIVGIKDEQTPRETAPGQEALLNDAVSKIENWFLTDFDEDT